MPQKKAAFKAMKVSGRRCLRNQSVKNELKTLTRKFNDFIAGKDAEGAKGLLPSLIKKIDKAKSKGVIRKRAASRKVSRIMKLAATLK